MMMEQLINTWRNFVNESNQITFEYVLSKAPQELKDILEQLKQNQENPKYHPEGNSFEHIKIVVTRLIETGDIDLIMAGFFHDLGKLATKSTDEKGITHAYGHEKISAKLVKKYSDWIIEMGANPEDVYEIVSEHMRSKKFEEMRPNKQETFRNLKNFDKLMKFRQADDMIGRNYGEI